MDSNLKPSLLIKLGALMAVLIAILMINPFVVVGAGERGVVFSRLTGISHNVLGEGISFVMPFVNSVTIYDVKTQKLLIDSECSTADLQDIHVKLAINYHLVTAKVPLIHQKIGDDYEDKVIIPAAEESIKASTAKFRIEEVVTKRQDLREKVIATLKDKLKNYEINLQDVSIMNIGFSERYTQSVEEKQIQEQRIKTREYERRQAEETAKKQRVLADAEAYKQKKIRQNVSKDVIAVQWIKKWDGKLPIYTGGNGNFIMPFKK